ncbi:fatty-acid--CoA ligase FadD4 [Mycolicibacter sinensis]|uniref:Acyl-CoA synthetase n=1 Tax=Mycolicibacter sinensis (strain JDM601) TaxID=875328 RepID=A0A1A3U0N4_MYCSD|nr:fatty-acid--CoA ligase FadD4 [Mycolicibacter sinensis]OBK88431.1 acyl-CoA synthetase [Mycolicibacter sinensis]
MQIRQHIDSQKPALVLHPSGTTVSFAELEARANRLAHHFRRAGLREGDVIAVVMNNNEHLHAVMWAARRTGLYYVVINTHLTAAESAYIVSNSGAAAVVGARATADLCRGIEMELGSRMPALRMIADAEIRGWQRYPACVADYPETPVPDEREGDLLQYSSGTTGKPKGIVRELSGLTPADAPMLLTPMFDRLGINRDSVYLNPAPLCHTAPAYWSMSAQAVGATTVVLERFAAEVALAAIEQFRVTHGQFVPAMFVRMLKLPEDVRSSYDLSSLHRVVHAAAPCPVGIKQQMIDWWGPILDEFYASSEGAGSTYITAEEWLTRPGSVGKPLVGVPHIVDDFGCELPPREAGEIYFGDGMEFSYLNYDGTTADSRNAQGWVTVGDMGYLDEDGYLFLTDRRHHMIISGGVNIYPQEAENMLITHPKVLDAAVFGIPDTEMGQQVQAAVQTADPADATADFAAELIAWLRDRLAHYKCPRSVGFERQLPRSDTGKLYKRELVEKYATLSAAE